MPQLTHNEEIDGVKVTHTTFQPMEVYRLGPRVAKMFIPVLSLQDAFRRLAPILMKALKGKDALSDADVTKALSQIDMTELAPVASMMLDELSKPENARLPVELLRRTQLRERDEDGRLKTVQLTNEAEIDDAFRGRVKLMFKVMWSAAVFNFADFFPGGQPSARTKDSEIEATNP